MADIAVLNPAQANGVLVASAAANATDRFAATQGRKYLLRIANAGGAPTAVTIDDPNSQLPAGGQGTAGTFADVVVSVTNGTQKAHLVDASRHADSSGWVNLATTPTTSVTFEVYGPL